MLCASESATVVCRPGPWGHAEKEAEPLLPTTAAGAVPAACKPSNAVTPAVGCGPRDTGRADRTTGSSLRSGGCVSFDGALEGGSDRFGCCVRGGVAPSAAQPCTAPHAVAWASCESLPEEAAKRRAIANSRRSLTCLPARRRG